MWSLRLVESVVTEADGECGVERSLRLVESVVTEAGGECGH